MAQVCVCVCGGGGGSWPGCVVRAKAPHASTDSCAEKLGEEETSWPLLAAASRVSAPASAGAAAGAATATARWEPSRSASSPLPRPVSPTTGRWLAKVAVEASRTATATAAITAARVRSCRFAVLRRAKRDQLGYEPASGKPLLSRARRSPSRGMAIFCPPTPTPSFPCFQFGSSLPGRQIAACAAVRTWLQAGSQR